MCPPRATSVELSEGPAPNVEIKVAPRVENREDSGGGLGGGMTAVTFEGFSSARFGVAAVAMDFRERTSL
jgi:hypothetical protein